MSGLARRLRSRRPSARSCADADRQTSAVARSVSDSAQPGSRHDMPNDSAALMIAKHHARGGETRLAAGLDRRRPCGVPPFQIATVERIDAPRADCAYDDPGIGVVRTQRRRFEFVIRTRRLDLPKINQRTDRAIKYRRATAPAGQPFVCFCRQAMAARDQRRLIVCEVDRFTQAGLKPALIAARDARQIGFPLRQVRPGGFV